MSKWGKHIAAIAVFLVLTVIYFSPAVFEGKVVRQGDTEKAIGMGNSQMDEYEKTAQPGEFSAWSDAMFGGMPYVSGYGESGSTVSRISFSGEAFKSAGIYGCGDGVYRIRLFLYLDVCHGRKLVVGDRWCHRFRFSVL